MKLTRNHQIREDVKALLNPGMDYASENEEIISDIGPEMEQRLLITQKPGALMQTLRDMDVEYDHWRIESIKSEVFIFYATDGWYKTILRASEKADLSEGNIVATDS